MAMVGMVVPSTVVSDCDLASGELLSGDLGTVDFVASCGVIDPCAAVDCAEGYECVNGDCVFNRFCSMGCLYYRFKSHYCY